MIASPSTPDYIMSARRTKYHLELYRGLSFRFTMNHSPMPHGGNCAARFPQAYYFPLTHLFSQECEYESLTSSKMLFEFSFVVANHA
jgi:hypothetical protein